MFAGTDACVSPILSIEEAPSHAHATARDAFVSVDGTVQPAPAPRFGRTPPAAPGPAPAPGADTEDVLTQLGYDEEARRDLRSTGAVS